ncbi:MAG: putative plasmid replication initiator protein [Actinobacteria bacterium]|nr:putative plasmid replication initiator protein [Actinomycetota bacterium]
MATALEEAGVREWTPGLMEQVVERAADPGFRRWEEQVAHTNHCHHPIRLQGRIRHMDKATGDIRTVYSTINEPDQTLLVACGNRRASVCPSCSSTYKGDARHIALAGLLGGKGVPDTVRKHPRLFVTFTAPSFGAMHTSIAQGKNLQVCRKRRGTCPHGNPEGCFRLHRPNDPVVGEPICAECFDYESMIVWNALAPELWRRTIQDIRRGIARAVGMSEKACNRLAWLNYFKVAEYQVRGAIHFHAILRLDDGAGRYDPEAMLPPPEGFDMALLEAVVRSVVPAVRAPDPRGGRIGWGTELDVKRLTKSAGANELSEEVVAFYVAKYASKGSESLGAALDRRIRSTEGLMALQGLRPHIGSAVRIAWIMGGRPELAELGLRHWAHCLGFGGHFATKSRRYSTTFKVLRGVRKEHRRRQSFEDETPVDAWDRPEDDALVVVLAEWGFKGTGYRSTGDRILAMGAKARALEGREALREERARAMAIA